MIHSLNTDSLTHSPLTPDMFQKIAPEYFKYMANAYATNKQTILCKVYGMYQVGFHNKASGRKVLKEVVVMENLFYQRRVTRVFDLKGSARSRYVPTENVETFDTLLVRRRAARAHGHHFETSTDSKVLMDDNLMELTKGLPLPLKHRANVYLQRAVENDTDFLAVVNTVDYSILVGIDENSYEIVVGIIDFMRQYDLVKKVERMGKSMIAQAEPTIIQPPQYKKRFRTAMERYFMSVPDKYDYYH